MAGQVPGIGGSFFTQGVRFLNSLMRAKLCAQVLDEQKLTDIKIFDVRNSLQITDYFVIATGRNPRHVKAAAGKLVREMRARKIRRRGLEGYGDGKWVLVDLADVVVHLFLEESRRYYDLELLWGDSPLVDQSA